MENYSNMFAFTLYFLYPSNNDTLLYTVFTQLSIPLGGEPLNIKGHVLFIPTCS